MKFNLYFSYLDFHLWLILSLHPFRFEDLAGELERLEINRTNDKQLGFNENSGNENLSNNNSNIANNFANTSKELALSNSSIIVNHTTTFFHNDNNNTNNNSNSNNMSNSNNDNNSLNIDKNNKDVFNSEKVSFLQDNFNSTYHSGSPNSPFNNKEMSPESLNNGNGYFTELTTNFLSTNSMMNNRSHDGVFLRPGAVSARYFEIIYFKFHHLICCISVTVRLVHGYRNVCRLIVALI